MKKQKRSLFRSISLGLAVVLGTLFFAYGFEVTDISLEETRNPQRQTSLQRVLRAIAHPRIFEYEKEEFVVSADIWMACPDDDLPAAVIDESGPYLVLEPRCGEYKDEVTVEGFNFEPNTKGPINFIPPSGVSLQQGDAEIDAEGHFATIIELPNRKSVDEPQELRVITRRNVGSPMFTQTAHDTWDKIVETVFMALLATTFGTILAVPISFLAARNLMKDVTNPLVSAALSIVFWPVGGYIGLRFVEQVGTVNEMFSAGLPLVGGLIGSTVVAWLLLRFSMPESDEAPSLSVRLFRYVLLGLGIFTAVLALSLLTDAAFDWGEQFVEVLGSFGFIGTFISDLGELFRIVLTAAVVLGTGAFFGSLGSRLGHFLNGKLPREVLKTLNFPIGAVAGATILVVLGFIAEWFYEFNNPALTLWWPAIVGAGFGVFTAYKAWKEDVVSTGLAIYYVSRTTLNALRSIEALIMVIIFSVWVSIGPFAGVLALSLHTVASLAKLYSEQVESISSGPLEAITATGATRLQMIIYGVIPQIVPPYIAFTIYRWDINVRMSTIIGFAGGGGIGSLLQQNINILDYRAASAQMLAIAIVVASMDYLSSVLRERVI